MRALLFLIALGVSVLIINSYSNLFYPVTLNFSYLWPQALCLLIGYYLISRGCTIKHLSDDLLWCIPVSKISIIISLVILVMTVGITGRDAKLEYISSTTLLYYLSLINSAILMMLLSAFMQPIYKELTKKTLSFIVIAILFFAFTNLSRTIAFYFVIALCLSKIKIDISKWKVFLWGVILITAMALMPILQGRTDSIAGAIERSILNIVFYIAYSFGLGGYLIHSDGISGISWGYLGYILSKTVNEPLQSNFFFDQKILYEFVRLGTSNIYGSLNANVMYPFWATLYYDFGDFSFIGYLFLLIIMCFSYIKKLYLIFAWIYFRFIVLGFLISPVLLRDSVIEMIIVLLFQFMLLRKASKRLSRED